MVRADPALINSDPYGAWLVRLEGVSEGAQLLSAADYAQLVKEG